MVGMHNSPGQRGRDGLTVRMVLASMWVVGYGSATLAIAFLPCECASPFLTRGHYRGA